MYNILLHLWRDEKGQDITEYGLFMMLLALGAVATLKTLGNAINHVFSDVAASLSAACGFRKF